MANEIGSLAADRVGSGPASWAEHAWHADSANTYPTRFDEQGDFLSLVVEQIVHGHAPTAPPLRPGDNVVTLGSCFAAELRHFLNVAGLSSDSFWVPSGLNNTFALLDFVTWCVSGQQTARGFRYERSSDGTIRDWAPAHEREEYLNKIRSAGALVFTLGLAEVWEDAETGQVFWRGVPESIFEKVRHRFRVSTIDENKQNLEQIITLIRTVNTNAPIVLTLSPVPLKATFQDISCMTADCVSKSILRVAIHETMLAHKPHVYYWPSFEIVKWLGCHLPYPVYGTDDGVVRHISRFMVTNILLAFVRCFYGEVTFSAVKATFESSISMEPGGPGEPPFLVRGTVVEA